MRACSITSCLGRVLPGQYLPRASIALIGGMGGGRSDIVLRHLSSINRWNQPPIGGFSFYTRTFATSFSPPSFFRFRNMFRRCSSVLLPFSTSLTTAVSATIGASAVSSSSSSTMNMNSLCICVRSIGTDGRVTNEDRRWWLLHLECTPDITPGTFVSSLDCCGTHTTKKLIERDIWTIEQVAALDADTVDELKYREGCIKMDVVWEHARTIISPLRQRNVAGGAESALQSRVLELRKKRELEKERERQLKERTALHQRREQLLQQKREAVEAKKEELRKKLQMKRDHTAAGKGGPLSGISSSPSSTSL